VLRQIKTMGHTYRDGKETRTETQSRSLIEWVQLWAKPGHWKKCRSFELWCKLGDDRKLQVGMRFGLYAQVGRAGPDSQKAFSGLAQMYGVGVPDRTTNGKHFLALSRDFIDDLLTGPSDENSDANSDSDGDAPIRARARDASPQESLDSSPSDQEETEESYLTNPFPIAGRSLDAR
jgi:hypothetical protein